MTQQKHDTFKHKACIANPQHLLYRDCILSRNAVNPLGYFRRIEREKKRERERERERDRDTSKCKLFRTGRRRS